MGEYTSGPDSVLTDGVVWSSSDTTVATIDVSGLATGKQAGVTTIRATYQGKEDTATLVVTPIVEPDIVVAEIFPVEVQAGAVMTFTYVLKPTLASDHPGFDRIEITLPPGTNAEQVRSVKIGQEVAAFTSNIADTACVISLPGVLRPSTNGVLIEISFDASVFGDHATFAGRILNSTRPEVSVVLTPGDATPELPGNRLTVRIPEDTPLMSDIEIAPEAFSPNGDGFYDQASIRYVLYGVIQPLPVRVWIEDMRGAEIRILYSGTDAAGRYSCTWDGRDSADVLVPIGPYRVAVSAEADTGTVRAEVIVGVFSRSFPPKLCPGRIVTFRTEEETMTTVFGAVGAVPDNSSLTFFYSVGGLVGYADANADGSFRVSVPTIIVGDHFDVEARFLYAYEGLPPEEPLSGIRRDTLRTTVQTRVPSIPPGHIVVSEPDEEGRVQISGRAPAKSVEALAVCPEGSVFPAGVDSTDNTFVLFVPDSLMSLPIFLNTTDVLGFVTSSTRLMEIGPAPARVTLPDLLAQPGDTLSVPVSIRGAAALRAVSFETAIAYDPDLLEPVHLSVEGTIGEGWQMESHVSHGVDADTLSLAMATDGDALPDSGDVLLVLWAVSPVAKTGDRSALSFAKTQVNEDDLFIEQEDGSIAVGIVFGDASRNGKISAYDASLILRHAVGLIALSPGDSVAADVTGDGDLSPYDASLVLQYVVGRISTFPVQEGGAARGLLSTRTVGLDPPERTGEGVFAIPLVIDEMDGVLSGEIEFSYSGGIVQAVRTADLTVGYLSAVNLLDRRVRLSFAGVESPVGRGCLAEILCEGAPIFLLDRVRLNEGRIPVRIVGKESETPVVYRLSQNYPTEPVQPGDDHYL